MNYKSPKTVIRGLVECVSKINFRGLSGRIKRARLLADGSEIKVETPWNAGEYPEDAFIGFSSATLPDETDTVVELEHIDGEVRKNMFICVKTCSTIFLINLIKYVKKL
ncbi:hypothetical protein SAMN05518847_11352 [Paenibacillus sp. OV219]|nr:hypothetical protein SAMN05518847_11352 [Paenibacillus sp. OV219]